jgi:hypothetical protein
MEDVYMEKVIFIFELRSLMKTLVRFEMNEAYDTLSESFSMNKLKNLSQNIPGS